jgi:hypothetical protein
MLGKYQTYIEPRQEETLAGREQNKIEVDRKRSSDSGAEDIAWLLVAGGVVGALVMTIRGQRSLTDWLIPVGLAGAGVAILLKQRETHIEEAQQNIMAELEGLDPVARAQVLRAVADQQLNIQDS